MDLQEAKERFERAIGYCDAIITVHRQHGGGKKGQRTLEPSLNRAVVVLAVAAWQTAVQDLTVAALDHAQPKGGTGVGRLLRGRVLTEVGAFGTPSAEKTRELMKLVDFDPYPSWTWRQRGGQGAGMITVTPANAASVIDDWLRLRHDIAHGHPSLSVVDVLEHVRFNVGTWLAAHPQASHKDALNQLKANGLEPPLHLKDAERCVSNFRRLATLTAKSVATTGVGPDVW